MFSNPRRRRITQPTDSTLVTKQSHKAECDINNILTQFKKTGIITHISSKSPSFADMPPEMDYQQSLEILLKADDAFATLPSVVRRAFDNDPAKLLLALADEARRPELEALGIINPKPTPQPAGNPANSILPSQNPPTLEPAPS